MKYKVYIAESFNYIINIINKNVYLKFRCNVIGYFDFFLLFCNLHYMP